MGVKCHASVRLKVHMFIFASIFKLYDHENGRLLGQDSALVHFYKDS